MDRDPNSLDLYPYPCEPVLDEVAVGQREAMQEPASVKATNGIGYYWITR